MERIIAVVEPLYDSSVIYSNSAVTKYEYIHTIFVSLVKF